MEGLNARIQMDEDPLASCGDLCSGNMKVCAYDYIRIFLPSGQNP